MNQVSLYLICILMCLLTACVEPLDEQAIIDKRIESKIAEYKEKRFSDCRRKAAEEAEAYVDSLIVNWVGSEVIDTITVPNRPARPQRPDDIIGTVKKFDIE